ncbi:MAG TPA: phosphatase PAP2 family protein [Stellaceae bacterium]|nr:phosphatase PAP2 family protein [Stellaceae bacterium]
MGFLASFGDAVVVLPVAAVTLLWLATLVGRRVAMTWCWAVLLAGGATALLKIWLSGCATPIDGLESPSGHTSMSTVVYGGLTLVAASEAESWPRVALGAAGAALVLAIAVSRVTLGAHSAIEVVVGLVIGGAALALFARAYLRDRQAGRPIWPLLTAGIILALALHGHSAELEPLWRRIAAALRNATGLCRA